MEDYGVVVTGVSGRMGQMLVQQVAAHERLHLCGALERPGHPWIGQDLGLASGGAAIGVMVSDDPLEAFARAHAVIDFTSPAATVGFAELAAQARLVHVIGTTGLAESDLEKIALAARHAVVVRAGNMSLGVNLLTTVTRQVAAALDMDWDIEIVESHHNQKVDAPSGTALMLGEAAAEGRGVALSDVSDRGRDGITGARKKGDIGFHAIRGGDIVGEHEVIFAACRRTDRAETPCLRSGALCPRRAEGRTLGAGHGAGRIRHAGRAGAELSPSPAHRPERRPPAHPRAPFGTRARVVWRTFRARLDQKSIARPFFSSRRSARVRDHHGRPVPGGGPAFRPRPWRGVRRLRQARAARRGEDRACRPCGRSRTWAFLV